MFPARPWAFKVFEFEFKAERLRDFLIEEIGSFEVVHADAHV
jgi:hypothetical protein